MGKTKRTSCTRRVASLAVLWLCLSVAASAQVAGPYTAASAPGGGPSGAAPVADGTEGGADVGHSGHYWPSLAIHPDNPDNVALAVFESNGSTPPPTNGFLRCSTDGGSTWTTPTYSPIPSGHANSGGLPSVAFDSQGRLFWAHITSTGVDAYNICVSRVDPTTGAILDGPHLVMNSSPTSGIGNDWPHLAADAHLHSPHADNLYLAWGRINSGGIRIRIKRSTDQGLTWSAAVNLSPNPSLSGEGSVVWPHVAVARNGDVYVAYKSQPTHVGGVPNGTSGQIFVLRSTDGGLTFPQKTKAFLPGDADLTYNEQHNLGTIDRTSFWMPGGAPVWVLPDPVVPGRVFVVTGDDPDDVHGSGDDADVVLAVSTDHGATWGTPTTIVGGPGDTFQVFATAAIDPVTGVLAVGWYDNRSQVLNGNNNWLLDWYSSLSNDGGQTWSPAALVSDASIDPDLSTIEWFTGPPPTLRLGERQAIALANGRRVTAWTGNDADTQILTDSLPGAVPPTPWADLAGGTAGVAGVPELAGLGSALPDTDFALALADGPPSALMLLWLAVTPTPFAAIGGTVHAFPFVDQVLLTTDGLGGFVGATQWPMGVPTGFEIYFQFICVDGTSPFGLTLSNGLRGTTP